MHLRTTINMVALRSGNRDGVVSMDSQVETVPGPQPQRGPPPATGVSDPEHVAGKGQSRATGYNFNICHWNAEGVRTKKLELQTFLKTHNIDVCCIQETHLSPNHRFSVRGFDSFRRDREHGPKGGLLILVKNIYPAAEIHRSGDEDTEVLGIKLILEGNPLSIYNLYSPPPKALRLHAIQPEEERWIIMGDFNSHSPSWGYPDLDAKGDEVEDWIITNQMVLINRPDEPHTYYSRAWRKTSCPDIAIATDDVAKTTKRHVEQQLGGSDHKPVLLVIKQDLREAGRKPFPSWNYKRANWPEFRKKADEHCRNQMMEQHHLNGKVKLFTEAILSAAKETIPRGRRRDYIPGWNAQLQELHSTASRLREKMESCPTDENTAAYNKAKAEFTRQKLQQTRAAWHEKTSSLNMEKDTGKLWTLTKLLTGEIPEKAQTVLKSEGEYIVQKEAANCLAKLYQEESNVKLPRERTSQVREQLAQLQKQPTSHNCMSQPITMKEIEAAIRQLKCKKAPGPDGVTNDMIKHLGPAAEKTLLELFNESWKNGTVPALWKKATIIPIHKKRQRQERPKQLPPHQPPKLPWESSGASNQQKIDIFLGRTENTVTNTDGISETQKYRRPAGPHCPRDRERLPRKEKGCLCFL